MARRDEPIDALEVLTTDQTGDIGRLVARVALVERRRACQHRVEEPFGDRLLDQDAEGTEADLAGVVELLGREIDGEVEVGVSEDHERRLATELEGQRHDVGGCCCGDAARSRHGSR